MQTITAPKKVIGTPEDRELMESVIKSACNHYQIEENDIVGVKRETNIVNLRRICIYIIKSNTSLRDYVIANRFGVSRTQVNQGFAIIRIHFKNYGQTANTIRTLVTIANNLDKKYTWHIQ